MNRALIENDQLPIADKILFEKMKNDYRTENERVFFEKMHYKELYEFPVSTFDTLMSETDNTDGLYIVKCYYSEYMIGVRTDTRHLKLDYIPTSLQEALDADLFPLTGKHISLLDWLRRNDYDRIQYDYMWEE